MKLLIVDNNLSAPYYPQGWITRLFLGSVRCAIRKPTNLSREDLAADRVVLTGSTSHVCDEKPWMHKEREAIEHWLRRGVPILGICFGAQLLARHLFGQDAVQRLPNAISGGVTVRYREGCPLFRGLPNPFGAMSSHYEGFVVPDELRIAETSSWLHYGFAYEDVVFGVQFHPELMGPIGMLIVRLQKLLLDRSLSQNFSVRTLTRHGQLFMSNFATMLLVGKGGPSEQGRTEQTPSS